jgi:hypothetical protein
MASIPRVCLLLILPAIFLAAACGGGSSASPTPSRTPAAALPADPPAGAIAVTDFRLFPSAGAGTTLVTLNITATVPSGYKTTWYTYQDGAWTALEPAVIVGGREPAAQNAFFPVPENVIVFAEPQ